MDWNGSNNIGSLEIVLSVMPGHAQGRSGTERADSFYLFFVISPRRGRSSLVCKECSE
jgi:hypothetical protein